MLYSTYVGGSDEDLAYSLALHDGEPVITGVTYSPAFPPTATPMTTSTTGWATYLSQNSRMMAVAAL